MAKRLGDKLERKERKPFYGDRDVQRGTFHDNVKKARQAIKSAMRRQEKKDGS